MQRTVGGMSRKKSQGRRRRPSSSPAQAKKRQQQRERVSARSQAERRNPERWRKRLLHPNAPTARPLREIYRGALDELDDQIAQKVASEMPRVDYAAADITPDTEVDPASAWEALEAIEQFLVAKARTHARRRGSAEWLFWLRRLRGQFHINSLRTTEPYIHDLAETLAAGESRPSVLPLDLPTFNFEFNETVLADLLLMRHAAIELYRLHATMKRCAKGQSVQFREGEVPYAVPDDVLEIAIHEYDQRNERSAHNLLDAVGLHAADRKRPPTLESFGTSVPLWHRMGDGSDDSRLPRPLDLNDPPPCMLSFPDLGALDPFHKATAFNKEHVALLILLWAAWFIVTDDEGEAEVRRRMTPLLQWGYLVAPTDAHFLPAIKLALAAIRDDPSPVIPAHLVPGSTDEVLATLRAMQPATRPPTPGCPIHDCPGHTLIDAVGASQRLFQSLVRPIDGAGANFWSDQFEADVQSIIDQTEWAPEGDLRKLVGKTIKKPNGDHLTDIDAVAVRSSEVLLVSCKAVAFTAELHAGEHRAVRELLDKTEKALTKWDEVISTVRDHPSLLGPSLPAGARISGLVVFPSTPFVVEARHRRRQGPLGIPPAVSSVELERALTR